MSSSLDVVRAVQALEESLQLEELREPGTLGGAIPSPVQQVLRALDASTHLVGKDAEEPTVVMLQTMRQHLGGSAASDLLLSLLSSSAFLLASDPRMAKLLGPTPPLLRRRVLMALVREIDSLWANFGQLLLQRLKTFLKGFRWLDRDESGAFGQTEFVRAYMELCMQAGAAASAEGFKSYYEMLRADAEFLFRLLAGSQSERSRTQDEDDEVGISLYSLVTRVVGLHDQDLVTFRRQVFSHHAGIEVAFTTVREDVTELPVPAFVEWCTRLRHLDERLRRRPFLPGGFLEDEDEPKKLVTSPELEAKCQRLFRGLDVNCSGALSVTEVKQAFAEVAPSVSFASIRRRILLTQGSLPTLMSEVKRASEDKDSDSEVEFATGAAGKVQAEKISELLELPTAQVCSFLEALEVKDASGKRKIKLPDDGTDYSLEELAISIFLCKPPDRDLEDLISELPKQDRDKGLSLDEFQRYVIRRTDRHMTLKLAAKSKPKTEAKRASTAVTSKADRSSKPCSLFTSEGYLPAKCTAEQLRVVYEALEQKNPCVSVNALLSSMKNVSDILAIDQRSYQGGERIVCNVRFGSETVPLLGKCPVVAVVPSRMTWAEEQKGWMLDGQKVKTFAQIGSLPTPLPPGSSGVFREAVLWLTAPWGVTEHRGFDVRLFVSDQGRVPLKQVGIPVSFAVHMPSPPAPVLEDVILEPGADSCSALLHWVPPLAATYCPPILKHILHIEPVIPRTQQTLEGGMAGEELDVWNRELRDFEKRRSFKIEHLQRGVPYRFAVQCVHQVPDAASSVKEVLGAQSDFCEAQTMPLQPAPPQPGAPDVRAWHNTGKLEILEVLLPFAEVDSVDRFCRVDIEYRSSGEWQRIPEAQMYLSHEPKWDDRLDSFALSCLLIGLKLETREGLELRARSFNSSGPSSWSPGAQLVLDGKEDEGGADAESAELHILAVEVLKTSAAVLDPKDHLPRNSGASALPRSRTQSRMSSARPSTTESSAKMPRALTQALGVARVSSDCGAPRLEGPRTHCCIQWHMEEGDLHYHVEAREERLPFYAPWAPLPAYFRNQKDEKVAEVFVGGLERFPANESLLLRLVKGSAKRGGVSATVRVPGVMGPPAPPTLQLTRTLTSPGSEQPVVELTWPANKELEKGVGHVIEASWELGDSRTEWATLCTARQMDSANEEANVCFVQLQQPEIKAAGAASQCWLRLRCLGPDGRLGDPSPETDAVQLADAMRSAVAAQEALRRASARKTPRRPQQLTVLGGSKNLWEVSWEQKRSAATSAFEAEVCFGTAGSDSQDWQPVRSLYLQQMTEDSTEKDAPAGPRLVQASVSLEADYTHLEQAWRLRVRVAGGDWSTPSAWQEPSGTAAELPHPSKPSVRSNVYTYTLEWAVSGGDALVQTLRYEVQVQARKRRGSSKFSDWVAVRSFYSPEEASGNSCAVTAVVERAAAAEAVKVSFGYEELRFRVRALSTQGASAFSEHSETEMLQVAQPAVQGEVPLPDLAGRGYVLLEDEKSKALVQSELLHLCWPKPELKVSELNEGTPQLEYRLETLLGTEDDESDWQANRALIISEPDSSIVTALVPLPEEEDEEDLDVSLTEEETRISLARKLQPVEARFRLCAERPSSDICRFDPVHSAPSATFCWDAPEMPEQVNVVGAAGNMLCVVFHWTSLARCCRGLLWACLELRFGDNEAPEEERPEAEAEAELEMSDVASETQSEIIGGLPVFWQPASELRQLSGAKVGAATPSQLLAQACSDRPAETTCVGMIPLPSHSQMSSLRVRLQLSVRHSVGQSAWSQPFAWETEEKAPEEVPAVRMVHLQYPDWCCVLPGPDEPLQEFAPRVVLKETTQIGSREIVITEVKEEARPRLRYEVVQGELPPCLSLDSSNGVITWKDSVPQDDDEPMQGIMDSFVAQVSFEEAWSDEHAGLSAPQGLGGSAPLQLAAAPVAFGGDDTTWELVRGVLRGAALEALQQRGVEATQAASELLQDPELVEGFADICETLASDVGLSAYEVVMRVLELPSNYLELAAEMDPDDFLDVLCMALDATDPDAEDEADERSDAGLASLDDGSEASRQGLSDDGLGSSSSDTDSDHQACPILDGEIRVELTPTKKNQQQQSPSLRNILGAKLAIPSPTGSEGEAPVEGTNSNRMSLSKAVSLTKAVAALGARRGSLAMQRRNSATMAARRASRAELQRRNSRLLPEGSSENLDGTGSATVGKFRSIRRISSHVNNVHPEDEGAQMAPKVSMREKREKEKPELELSYNMPPMWPAFEELEFYPTINSQKPKARRRSIFHSVTHTGSMCEEPARRDSLPKPRFSISPGLPAQIALDESTGIIRGCPLMEHVTGRSYIVTACDPTTGETMGRCSLLFAVAPAEVARLCNAAFLGAAKESTGYPGILKSPLLAKQPDPARDGATLHTLLGETARQGLPSTLQPPLHGTIPALSSARPWMTAREALCASLAKHSPRQTGVRPLGPPLKDRERKATLKGSPWLPPVKLLTPRN
ncbi:unnamed protein product [Effrenium voratum]|uniref:EF-hand domain-containing protein n=1 Tax=Effrenium voratum TaxID=2562239 RepID=A0AA36IC42_9DINO|nr:unnamed protein product [Effrenium voratum]